MWSISTPLIFLCEWTFGVVSMLFLSLVPHFTDFFQNRESFKEVVCRNCCFSNTCKRLCSLMKLQVTVWLLIWMMICLFWNVQIFEVHHSYHNTIFLNYFKPCYCGFRIKMKGNNSQQMLINVSLGMMWWAYIVITNSFKALISFLILTLSFECYNSYAFLYFCFPLLMSSDL